MKQGFRRLFLLAMMSAVFFLLGTGAQPAEHREEPAVAVFSGGVFRDEEVAEMPTSDAAITTEAATNPEFQMEIIHATPSPRAEKRILIYHSHTWEAFAQVESAPYAATEKWRTKDNSANVVAVGRALAAQLTALGYTVVQDETAFEPPDLGTAYKRSLSMLEARQQSGEQYDLYIDLHRDAFAATAGVTRTVGIAGENVARFMVLIGKGTGQTGNGYAVKPDWQANLRIAQAITDNLNKQHERLCRDVKIKTGRFNQHIASKCVLIECGCNLNTLEEVLRGIPYLAVAIDETLMSME